MKAEAAMGNNSTNIHKENNHLSSQMVLVFRVCLCLFVFCFFLSPPCFLCSQHCQCLQNIHFWKPLRCSITSDVGNHSPGWWQTQNESQPFLTWQLDLQRQYRYKHISIDVTKPVATYNVYCIVILFDSLWNKYTREYL